MRVKTSLILGTLLTLFVLSCSMVGDLHGENGNGKLFDRLYRTNGNAFYIKSTNVSISFVWTYSLNKIIIYKLSKSKIINVKELPITGSKWLFQFSKKELFEADSCLELDGDMFGFKLKYDRSVVQNDLSINLDCFVTKEINSIFLNGVINDINEYQIRW
jgi:hypothetical protein